MIVGRGSFSIESWPIFSGTTCVLVPPKLLYVDFHTTKQTTWNLRKSLLEKEKHLRIYQLFRFHGSFWEGVSFVTHNFVCFLCVSHGCDPMGFITIKIPPFVLFSLLFPTTKQANLSTSPLFMIS